MAIQVITPSAPGNLTQLLRAADVRLLSRDD